MNVFFFFEFSAANEQERLEFEIKELKVIVEEKSAMIRSLEAEKETLTVELAASQELSKMHEHLQVVTAWFCCFILRGSNSRSAVYCCYFKKFVVGRPNL